MVLMARESGGGGGGGGLVFIKRESLFFTVWMYVVEHSAFVYLDRRTVLYERYLLL